MQNGPGLQHREADHRSDQDGAGAERRAQGWSMHTLVEASKPQQTERPGQGQAGSQQHEGGGEQRSPVRQSRGLHHSITSPRIRNFANATVPTKPSSAMTSAASK